MSNNSLMKLFMEPNSIAFVGVSRRTGDGTNILENLLNYGYSGDLFPVNPSVSEILGVKTYSSVKDIPVEVDLAVIYTSRSLVPQMVKECTEKGIKAIAVIAQGFADSDEEGRSLQKEMCGYASEGGARIIGPNSFGVANGFINLNTAFLPFDIDRLPIATIAQSGLLFAGGVRLKFLGKAIDLGNACDISFEEALEYFGTDPDIKVIAVYMEGVRDGRRFIETAKQVGASKPIIALKGGKTLLGATTVLSHTGSLAGKNEVYSAAFRQSGVVVAEDFDDLEDLVTTFRFLPFSSGNKLGIITVPMAGGVMATDACVRHGFQLATLSSQTRKKIAGLLPPWLGAGNPVDIGISPFTEAGASRIFQEAVESLLMDPQVDALLLIVPSLFFYKETYDLLPVLTEAVDRYPEKPVVTWLYMPDDRLAADFSKRGLVLYPTIERAVKALSRLAAYSQFREGATRF